MPIQRRPPLVVRIPNRELGPASGPFPALRIASEGTTRVKIVTAGTAEPGRVSQRRSWGTEDYGGPANHGDEQQGCPDELGQKPTPQLSIHVRCNCSRSRTRRSGGKRPSRRGRP